LGYPGRRWAIAPPTGVIQVNNQTAVGILFALAMAPAMPGPAQDKPDMTAQQIIDKSIEASGGRAAHEKVTSRTAKGSFTLAAMGASGSIEIYAKAPDKSLSVISVEGFGEIRNGCDGKVVWAENPQQGLTEMEGEAAAVVRRSSVFNLELKWRDMYPKADVKGKQKLGEREAWVVELTPADGKPVTHYYDAETFLLVGQDASMPTMEGLTTVATRLADYRDVDGVKVPFKITQTLPMGDLVVTLSEAKHNQEIDDARFAKPEAK